MSSEISDLTFARSIRVRRQITCSKPGMTGMIMKYNIIGVSGTVRNAPSPSQQVPVSPAISKEFIQRCYVVNKIFRCWLEVVSAKMRFATTEKRCVFVHYIMNIERNDHEKNKQEIPSAKYPSHPCPFGRSIPILSHT